MEGQRLGMVDFANPSAAPRPYRVFQPAAVKARKPIPQEKLLEQIHVNCDGSTSYQRQGLTQS